MSRHPAPRRRNATSYAVGPRVKRSPGTRRYSCPAPGSCFWPGMSADVFNHCRSCHRCQVAKAPTSGVQHPPGHLVAQTTLEIVAIDSTRLQMSRDGYEDVLVITDVFIKWVVAVPVKDQSAETVVRLLIDEWILNFGAPTQLHSDREGTRGGCPLYLTIRSPVVKVIPAHHFYIIILLILTRAGTLNRVLSASYATITAPTRAGLPPITHLGMASASVSTRRCISC